MRESILYSLFPEVHSSLAGLLKHSKLKFVTSVNHACTSFSLSFYLIKYTASYISLNSLKMEAKANLVV